MATAKTKKWLEVSGQDQSIDFEKDTTKTVRRRSSFATYTDGDNRVEQVDEARSHSLKLS